MSLSFAALIEHCFVMRAGLENFMQKECNEYDSSLLNLYYCSFTSNYPEINTDATISSLKSDLVCPIQLLSEKLMNIVKDVCNNKIVNILRIKEALCLCEGLLPDQLAVATVVADTTDLEMKAVEDGMLSIKGIGIKRKSTLTLEEKDSIRRKCEEFHPEYLPIDDDDFDDLNVIDDDDLVVLREGSERTIKMVAAIMLDRRNDTTPNNTM